MKLIPKNPFRYVHLGDGLGARIVFLLFGMIAPPHDRSGNRLWRKDLVAESYGAGFDELYRYDGLYRLQMVNRGTLNATQTGVLRFRVCLTASRFRGR